MMMIQQRQMLVNNILFDIDGDGYMHLRINTRMRSPDGYSMKTPIMMTIWICSGNRRFATMASTELRFLIDCDNPAL